MLHFDPARATSAATSVLPPYLAVVPVDVRNNDGCHIWRGPRTGRTLRHASKLVLGLVATLESYAGVQDVLSFDDVVADGGPDWAEALAGRLDPDLAPDILVKGTVAGGAFVQAVTCVDDLNGAAHVDREGLRVRYREHGCVWSLFREGDLNPFLASGSLWVGEAVRRGAPDAAIETVEKAILNDGGRTALAELMFNAAIRAGVHLDVAADALGYLVHSGRIGVDFADGMIVTDRPFVRASHIYPASIMRSWRNDASREGRAVVERELV